MSALTKFASQELAAAAVAADAPPMQAYMKTTMPFFGVKKPGRVPIIREMKKRFAPDSHRAYVENVSALWRLKHREEKYLALAYAHGFKRYISADAMPLYERLIREGQWWDLVDEVVGRLVSPVYAQARDVVRPTVEAWIEDEDMWVRRAAILSQLEHKGDTDAVQLFDFCRRTMHEREFFIRKAIGWALREYAKSQPEAVKAFLQEEKAQLSGLSFREASKHLSWSER